MLIERWKGWGGGGEGWGGGGAFGAWLVGESGAIYGVSAGVFTTQRVGVGCA